MLEASLGLSLSLLLVFAVAYCASITFDRAFDRLEAWRRTRTVARGGIVGAAPSGTAARAQNDLAAVARDDLAAAVQDVIAAADQAKKKAIALLKEWLSPDQLRDYELTGGFHVVGSSTGTLYRILSRPVQNVWDPVGSRVYCFGPTGVPLGDIMLAQKIALENFETEALAKANRFDHSLFGAVGIDMSMAQRPSAL